MATQILTGHAALNYHLSKVNRIVEPICPLCEVELEEETLSHLLGQCPMLGKLRAELFDTYYTTATDIVDYRYNLRQIISFVYKSKRLER